MQNLSNFISDSFKAIRSSFYETVVVFCIAIFGLCLTIEAQAQTIGPFKYSSWRSSDFKKPPFKTGVRSCQMLFGANAPPIASVKEVHSKWPAMARDIKATLFELISSQHPNRSRQTNIKKSYLSNSLCNGATACLIQALDKHHVHLDVTPVITAYRIDAIEAKHIYLLVENYYAPNEHLILDPTIRQFFSKPLANRDHQQSQAEINKKIPMLFVGSAAELKKLFEEHYKPTEADPEQTWQDVVDFYLSTNVQKHFFNNDF